MTPLPLPSQNTSEIAARGRSHTEFSYEAGLNEVSQIAQRLAGVIWQVLQFIWNWSFGQVVKMFQMPFDNLPCGNKCSS